MKNFFFGMVALLSIGYASTVTAQTIPFAGRKALNKDTIVNTETMYNLTSKIATSGLAGNYNIQTVVRRVTGTTPSAKIILQSSIDGVHWENHFRSPGVDGVNCDTFQVTSLADSISHTWNAVTKAVKTYAGVSQYTNAGRRYFFRTKNIGETGSSTMEISTNLITQE